MLRHSPSILMVQRAMPTRLSSQGKSQLPEATQELDSQLPPSQEAKAIEEAEAVQSFPEYQVLPKHRAGLGRGRSPSMSTRL